MSYQDKLKRKDGITGIDISVSILIITLFTGVISGLLYNIYLTSMNVTRTAIASNIAIDLLEYAQELDYEDVGSDLVIRYEQNIGQVPNGYTCTSTVTKHSTLLNEKEDIIKIIEVNIEYSVGKMQEQLILKTLKVL